MREEDLIPETMTLTVAAEWMSISLRKEFIPFLESITAIYRGRGKILPMPVCIKKGFFAMKTWGGHEQMLVTKAGLMHFRTVYKKIKERDRR